MVGRVSMVCAWILLNITDPHIAYFIREEKFFEEVKDS